MIDTLGRPPTSNARQHWAAKAKVTAQWREAAGWTARAAHVPPLTAISVEAWCRYPSRRSLPDPDACAPGVKAALDGLQDVRVIANDSYPYVRSVVYLPPEVEPGLPAALVLRITEAESSELRPSPITAEMRRLAQ